ncbi:MAG TPA: T9SS type A sorting domain-containing protein, partial [Candidatus Marinimicrobia bacterium]|nr:T9SS type A sorting domain-containing protein [Candidatus Neomarinimicrobiota bacterium]
GWTMPSLVTPTSEVLLPARSIQDSIIKVQIDDDEYFLIENRNNWFRDNVNIDSVRYAIYDNTDDYPDYVEVLFDSVDISFDENGVVTSVSSYDLGLPASGLLIWHIDESVIRTAPDEYSINADRERKGIDLEEADGAQDIGYPNIHLFTDPTSGYFGDMWFDGNLEYETVNGVGPPEFSPYSYPDTKSNDGASTFLSIENISVPGDTMSFTVSNTFLVDGFPDTTAFIRTVYDLNGDGVNEVFGGKDSLWWAHSNDLTNRQYLFPLESDSVFIGFERPNIKIFLDSAYFVVYNKEGTSDSLSLEEWENHQKRVFVSINGIKDSISLEEINSKWTGINFDYIAGIDIDLDASLDVLALNVDGFLYCYNSGLILLAGFPLDIQLQPPILSRDLIDDFHPEIVARSADSTSLYVFDYQGRIQYQFASRRDDELVALENINGHNSILTRSSVYQFGEATETDGNEWAFEHGDWGRSRTVTLNYPFTSSGNNLITRAYCYPNPIRENKGTFRVESVNAEKVEIVLYDLAGYYIDTYSKNVTTSGNQISEWVWDVSDIESGVYFGHLDVSKNSK